MISVVDDTISVTFNRFDLDAYGVFLQSKKLPEYSLDYDSAADSYRLTTPKRFAHIFELEDVGTGREWLPLNQALFDYQRFIVQVALDAKRYAVWADTGLGKTIIQLEFARQVSHRTRGKVLMIVPLNIIQQTIEEADKFYGDGLNLQRLATKEAMIAWCVDGSADIGIVNPEKFIPRNGAGEIISEIRYCAGVVLDESSLLKAGGGKIKWALIKSCRGIEYKLSCTATPAPNDTMEYASQASFLEKLRNEGEILWTYFRRDKDGNWKVKEHAKEGFYRFMAGWSIYLRNPKVYGFADNLKNLPDPVIKKYFLALSKRQHAEIRAVPDDKNQLVLFRIEDKLSMIMRSKYSQLAKGFVYKTVGGKRIVQRIHSRKPFFVTKLIYEEVRRDLQVLVWTVFDEESNILGELLGGRFSFDILTGAVTQSKRIEIIESFRNGRTQVLISKASLLGHGLNFQNCGSMIFSGFDDSFERLYQAIRRSYRYGQTKTLRVHIPYIKGLEGVVWDNLMAKQGRFEKDMGRQERNYLKAMREQLNAYR